jgi:phosphoribosylformylglycinamidine cyclo-ligase
MIAKLADLGIDIKMCGGETADVGDLVRTLIVDSTIVAREKRDNIINAANIKPGDIIVGLASFGQATYESSYNSGMSSNGLTAARHMLLSKYYFENYKESFSDTIGEDKAYCGKYRLTDKLPGSEQTVGEAILSPTRTFMPVIKAVLEKYRSGIDGIIHCTGGGQAKCRDFGNNVRYVKDNLFELPPLFKAIYESGEIPMKEMFQVFNCGHRIEFYCDSEETAAGIMEIASSFNIESRIVGHVEQSNGNNNEVIIKYQGEEFVYN